MANIKRKISVLPDPLLSLLGSFHRRKGVAFIDSSNSVMSAYIDKLEKKRERLLYETRKKADRLLEKDLLSLADFEEEINALKGEKCNVDKKEARLSRRKITVEREIAKLKKKIEIIKTDEKHDEEILNTSLQQIIAAYTVGVMKEINKEKRNVQKKKEK